MTRDDIVGILRPALAGLRDRYGVLQLTLFGSAGRDELTDQSDVDIIVRFEGRATFDRYFGVKRDLEELLGRDVDLATEKMIRTRLRSRIEGDLLDVA